MSINMSFDFKSRLSAQVTIAHLKMRGFKCQESVSDGRKYYVLSLDESKFKTFFKMMFFGLASLFNQKYESLYKESVAVWHDNKRVYVIDCQLPATPATETPKPEAPEVVTPVPAVLVESASSSSSNGEDSLPAPSRLASPQGVAVIASVAAAAVLATPALASASVEPAAEIIVPAEEKPMKSPSVNKSAGLKPIKFANENVAKAFAIDSSKVQGTPGMNRKIFLMQNDPARKKPLILSKSEFVSEEMAVHLMKNKRDVAIGTKYVTNSIITNMEGAMHSFLTPVASIQMCGDYAWKGGHSLQPVKGLRDVILSAAIHPDFECAGNSEVVMKLVKVTDDAQEGKSLPEGFQPLASKAATPEEFRAGLAQHELELQKHMIYHLTADHRLPARGEISCIQEMGGVMMVLENLIRFENFDPTVFKNQFMSVGEIGENIISLEAMFNLYVHQIRNEFSALEAVLPQGYVYTIDPPSIFVAQLGGAKNAAFLNRLQALALKHVNANTPLQNLKLIGFNNFADPKGLEMLKHVFPGKVVPKAELFQNALNYSVNESWALVLHNNSDAFGQNIETEGTTSMDGIIGVYSDAAVQLKRDREDIGAHIV